MMKLEDGQLVNYVTVKGKICLAVVVNVVDSNAGIANLQVFTEGLPVKLEYSESFERSLHFKHHVEHSPKRNPNTWHTIN